MFVPLFWGNRENSLLPTSSGSLHKETRYTSLSNSTVRRLLRLLCSIRLPIDPDSGYSTRVVMDNTQKGGNWVIVKRIVYLATAALLAMLILVPSALAQDAVPAGDDDPFVPEQNVTVVDEAQLEQIAGSPEPSQGPTTEPVPVAGEPLPKTGGPEIGSAWVVILPASALLLGLGVLAYGVSRRR
jgi:hypothetical protein